MSVLLRKYSAAVMAALLMVLAAILPMRSFAQDSQPAPAPRFVLDNDAFDAGEVKEGEVIEHAFKVLNKGDAPLEIKDVKPG